MDSTGAHPTPDALRTAPGFQVRRLYQAYTAAWARQVDTTTTGPQYSVLVAVAAYPGADQGSLAASVSLDRSTMADVCRRLEDRGLIDRSTAPGDGRRKLLSLTDSGHRVLADIGVRANALAELLMSDDERTGRFLGDLEALGRRWENLCEDRPRPLRDPSPSDHSDS